MPLTIDDAVYVARLVVIDVIKLLPEGIMVDYPALQNPSQIFEMLTPSQFKLAFDNNVAFFQKVLKCTINVKGVDAFVSPEQDRNKRKVYIKLGADETPGVLVHEFIHWLSHPDFYPNFYEKGGTAPNIVEGVTEYFTRKYYPNRTYYNEYFVKIDAIGHMLPRIQAALFKGDAASIQAISQAYK